ncbi:unnamed protein product [Darwinula stevensoni]|uniref:EF-hand domain-containing protein n=1 Tax=Darwinula stevensoni TaxID=69355 RepID=A0A7R9AIZ8_9CRUS|nr:unnamed protein product [Darwinula stevensoni]CAG0906593.1 unnamed protein product [Darwinula stevensoni]
MLDGLELLSALMHVHTSPDDHDDHDDHDGKDEKDDKDDEEDKTAKLQREQELKRQLRRDIALYTHLIDQVLAEDDLNRDGFLSYFEFSLGRRREEKLLNS